MTNVLEFHPPSAADRQRFAEDKAAGHALFESVQSEAVAAILRIAEQMKRLSDTQFTLLYQEIWESCPKMSPVLDKAVLLVIADAENERRYGKHSGGAA